jgi:hypothetical protein
MIATQLLHEAASKVTGIASPFGKDECKALLEDSRIDLSPRGPLKVLMERIFENDSWACLQGRCSFS